MQLLPLCADMRDQLASSGRLTPMVAQPALHQQYPLPCYVRQQLRANRVVSVRKVVLMGVQHAIWPSFRKEYRHWISAHKVPV